MRLVFTHWQKVVLVKLRVTRFWLLTDDMLLSPIRIFPVSGNSESWSGSCFSTIYEIRSLFDLIHYVPSTIFHTGPCSAVGNVSGYRCVSDCRSSGHEFDLGTVPYFRGDWSWNDFYGHSPPFRWFIQEGLLSVTSESMCTNYWLTACSSLPREKCG